MKNIIIAYMSVLGMASAYAASDDVVNSQMYVDNAAGNLQTNLPAKTSEKVVTYTTTAGTTGERDIKTELGNESTNTSDNGIPTVGTVNAALDDKQNKLNPLNNVNIVTYTGTNNPSNATGNYYGRGVVTTTPIYDSTVNTFDNGLVTAKTLNDAVIAGVNAEATKITTDPKGALWVFNRTPPKVLPTTANLPANIQGYGWCYNPSLTDAAGYQGSCSTTMFNSFERGDWGATFPYNTGITYGNDTCVGNYCYQEIRGISACITDTYPGNTAYAAVPTTNTTLINKLESAYESGKAGASPVSAYCYCKMIEPVSSVWVYRGPYSNCQEKCATECGWGISRVSGFRRGIFAASPVPAQ